MFGAQARRNATLILVTHDEKLASRCSRTLRMTDGRIAPTPADQVPA
jgi:putative ABC transport system ATP-binding protein